MTTLWHGDSLQAPPVSPPRSRKRCLQSQRAGCRPPGSQRARSSGVEGVQHASRQWPELVGTCERIGARGAPSPVPGMRKQQCCPARVVQCRQKLPLHIASEFSRWHSCHSVGAGRHKIALETEHERYAKCLCASLGGTKLCRRTYGKASLALVGRKRCTGQTARPLYTSNAAACSRQPTAEDATGGGCVTHHHCWSTRAGASCRVRVAGRRSRWTCRRAMRMRIFGTEGELPRAASFRRTLATWPRKLD